MKIRISDDLVFSADFVTATAGIFATKGMGKSYLAQVVAEEMLENGQVIVVIDPTDAWNGLRSSADGTSEGYPILVVGGDRGALKLEAEAGAGVRLAEAIVAERFSCVICTDGLDETAAIRYVREVLQTLFRKNREPIHVFVDEADIFAPQQPKEEEDHRCIRALAHVVRRGRKKGIGTTLITQRPAELNASVRTMVEMLFVLGMLHNLDIEAVEKWLRLRKKKKGDNAAFELQEAMIDSLDTLQCGDAWVWAPRLKIHRRFRARAKRTFDSGATPKAGQKIRAPKKLAQVDIQRLGAAIAEAAQRQKENDPAELKKQVAALKKELAGVGKGQDRAEANEKELHAESHELRSRVADLERQLAAARKSKQATVEVIKPADLRRLEELVKKIDKLVLRITGTNADLELHLSGLRAEATRLVDVASSVTQLRGKKAAAIVGEVLDMAEDVPPRHVPARAVTPSTAVEKSWSKGDPLHHAYVSHPPKSTPAAEPPKAKSTAAAKPTDDGALPKCERSMLIALAQHPRGLTRKQVLIFSGYRHSGTTTKAFARLLAEGLAQSSQGLMVATPEGLRALGDYEPLPIGDELRAQLLNGGGDLSAMEKEILRRACEAYPQAIDRTSARGDYAHSGSTTKSFARLIAMNYVKKVRGGVLAAEELFG
ncbi:MAG TPA: DUF87 domain-containing protein [Gaiellaceae bacterium]|nr:DUF87 domain-containing protein [Gaiellaceae bacterium]